MDNYLKEMSDILEPLKVDSALSSEELKLNYRKQNNPKAISILDYTIIEALKRQIPKEVDTDEINRGIGISGEYDIDFNMLCPNCKEVVGDYEANELYYKHCPNCGQKLKYTEQQE